MFLKIILQPIIIICYVLALVLNLLILPFAIVQDTLDIGLGYVNRAGNYMSKRVKRIR